MKRLVEQYGAVAVYAVAERDLGYPPTWIETGGEVRAIHKHLEKEFELHGT